MTRDESKDPEIVATMSPGLRERFYRDYQERRGNAALLELMRLVRECERRVE
jgi:hypothetical protein